MRNLKKFLALVLAMMMTLSLMVTVNASSFDDDEDITKVYAEAVDVLTELGVIKGYGGDDPNEGKFLPKNNITRAEVAAILYRLYTGDVNDDNIHLYDGFSEFTDVGPSQWFTPYVNFCANNGLIQGRGNGKFDPKGNITGYETLVMILRAIGYNDPKEFSSSDWRFKASGYGDRLGLTSNIPAGSLGASATREMVSEIMFKGILAPMVKYSPLTLYTTDLLVDAAKVNAAAGAGQVIYTKDVPNTLMYQTFKIVGKRTILGNDAFGRPVVEWVKDAANDTVDNGGKFIPNVQSAADGTIDPDGNGATNATYTTVEDAKISLAMTPVKVYDNAIDECSMTKDINNDKSIAWGAITEVLNGEAVAQAGGAARSGYLDAIHTTTNYIGATGRTTEIYKLDEVIGITSSTGAAGTLGDPGVVAANKWIFVYIDTFLAKVTATTDATTDTNGHIIIGPKATVTVGNGAGAQTLTLDNTSGAFKKGDLVLLQTPDGVDTDLDVVDAPEKAPLIPTDVPNTTAEFTADSVLVGAVTKVANVTIKGTRGAQDSKMGIVGSNDTTYYASNTFLAARAANTTVLASYYDVDSATLGITNSMIGKTYDLYLDAHGYIIGMVQVLEVSSPVGVITSIEGVRVGAGKYVAEVEALLPDGTTGTFQLLDDDALGTPGTLSFFTSLANVDAAFAVGGHYVKIGVGSLVEFGQKSLNGGNYWYISEYDSTGTVHLAGETDYGALGTADANDRIDTGVTDTLVANSDDLNDNTIFYVAEYDFRYNQGNDNNDGGYVDKTYKIYKGFKNIPTAITADTGNVLYQKLSSNHVLIYAKDIEDDYTLVAKDTIAVDDSYLVLSRGATYAEYSEYNVLKNGELTTLKVSNINTGVNAAIETAMAGGELIMVTGRNTKGYVTSADTLTSIAADATSPYKALATANCGNGALTTATPVISGSTDVAYGAGVLTVATGDFLTVADDVKVMIVNLDRGTTYESSMAEAIMYANGFTADSGTVEAPHDLVFEVNNLGYVCALYVLD